MKFEYFNFSDVFEYKRGRRLIKINQVDGDIPYISSTKFNNGIDSYITPPSYMTVYNNCITIANSGSVGYAFYHDYDFVASDHVTVLWLRKRKLNRKIAMYLITVLEKLKDNYFFNREISDKRINKEKILLPVNSKGEINYQYMEDEIDKMLLTIQWKKRNVDNYKPLHIDFTKWSYYNFNDIFKEVKRGKVQNLKMLNEGDCPVISSSVTDQGILGFYDVVPKYNNCLTISLNGACGYCVYHDYPFNLNSDCGVLVSKYDFNKYVGVFMSIVINKISVNYQYGRKLSKERLSKEKLFLPSKNGKPDWGYMEDYIKSLPYSNKI